MIATPHEDPAEQSGCLRFYYRNWRPIRLGKIWVSGLGLTPKILLTLQVKSRSSGRLCSTVLVVANHQGQRYLVSMLGDRSGCETFELHVERLSSSGVARARLSSSKSHLKSERQSSRVGAKSLRAAVATCPFCKTLRYRPIASLPIHIRPRASTWRQPPVRRHPRSRQHFASQRLRQRRPPNLRSRESRRWPREPPLSINRYG